MLEVLIFLVLLLFLFVFMSGVICLVAIEKKTKGAGALIAIVGLVGVAICSIVLKTMAG